MPLKTKMKISDLETISGVSRSTIHYYIRKGLLHRADKTGRTMGYYDETHVIRLKEIKKIQQQYISTRNKPYMPIHMVSEALKENERKNKSNPAVKSRHSDSQLSTRDRRKQELVEAAMRLYPEKGFYFTNLKDIAREAGISPSAFYTYYNDKRELFAHVIETLMQDMGKKLSDATQKETDTIKRGMRMLLIFRKGYPAFAEILWQLRVGVSMGDAWASEKLSILYKYLSNIVADEIKRLIDQGAIRDTNPELMGMLILNMAEGAVHLPSVYERYNFDQIILFAADIITNSLTTTSENQPRFDPKTIKHMLKTMEP